MSYRPKMITTTLRPEEVELLDDLADKIGDGRPWIDTVKREPLSRAATMRMLLRFGLEHLDDFGLWVKEQR